jgi:hypothetical protein
VNEISSPKRKKEKEDAQRLRRNSLCGHGYWRRLSEKSSCILSYIVHSHLKRNISTSFTKSNTKLGRIHLLSGFYILRKI